MTWLIPAAVTVAVFGWAVSRPIKTGDYCFDFTPIFALGGAVIASLVAWLVWAIVT